MIGSEKRVSKLITSIQIYIFKIIEKMFGFLLSILFLAAEVVLGWAYPIYQTLSVFNGEKINMKNFKLWTFYWFL
jgi:hypothetical protein